MFNHCGIIHIKKNEISEEEVFELAINAGAKDCFNKADFHEILSNKEDFYKVKSQLEKNVDNFSYSGIEWRPYNYLDIPKGENEKIVKILELLDDDDDIQKIFTNCKVNL